jgi:hypothetical protein
MHCHILQPRSASSRHLQSRGGLASIGAAEVLLQDDIDLPGQRESFTVS